MIARIPSSTLAVYAVVAIARMSSSGKPVSGSYLANSFGLKARTFEPLLQRLARAGVIKSVRGQSGGYILSDPNNTTLADIVRAASFASETSQDSQKALAISAIAKIVDPYFVTAHEKLLEYYSTISLSQVVAELAKSGQTLLPEDWIDFSI